MSLFCRINARDLLLAAQKFINDLRADIALAKESRAFIVAACRDAQDIAAAAQEQLAALRASNAELLAALKRAEEWLNGWASAEPYLSEIRAAIEAAK